MSYRFQSARPNLFVRDVALAVEFYARSLGMELRFAVGDPPSLAVIAAGDVELGLVHAEGARDAALGAANCYLEVEGVDALHERCRAAGIPIENPLSDHPWGMRDFVIRDPDGHLVAIGERVAPPSAA